MRRAEQAAWEKNSVFVQKAQRETPTAFDEGRGLQALATPVCSAKVLAFLPWLVPDSAFMMDNTFPTPWVSSALAGTAW